MYEQRIPLPPRASGTEQVIALFRTWRAALERGTNPLAAMSATLDGRWSSPELLPACGSFFALTQACLGRPLLPASADSPTLSVDEEALLETLRQVPALLAEGPNAQIPHGLPGALQWAAFAVLRAWNAPPEFEAVAEPPSVPLLCPFGHAANRVDEVTRPSATEAG
jgi:hypothetical protein